MKVTVTEKEDTKPEIKYPWIGESKTGSCVVLFYANGCGIVIDDSGTWPQGRYSKTWAMDNFVPFTKAITLQND